MENNVLQELERQEANMSAVAQEIVTGDPGPGFLCFCRVHRYQVLGVVHREPVLEVHMYQVLGVHRFALPHDAPSWADHCDADT